jgi:hypothetical protein
MAVTSNGRRRSCFILTRSDSLRVLSSRSAISAPIRICFTMTKFMETPCRNSHPRHHPARWHAGFGRQTDSTRWTREGGSNRECEHRRDLWRRPTGWLTATGRKGSLASRRCGSDACRHCRLLRRSQLLKCHAINHYALIAYNLDSQTMHYAGYSSDTAQTIMGLIHSSYW